MSQKAFPTLDPGDLKKDGIYRKPRIFLIYNFCA